MKKAILATIIMVLILSTCVPVQAQDYDDTWTMTLNNHVIWIGERLEINITGIPGSWVKLTMANTEDVNITFYRDAITDENGTVIFEFYDFYTEQAGRYVVELRIEGNRTPTLMDSVEINYDDVLYIFLVMEKWAIYFGVDIYNFNPEVDMTLTDKFNNMEAELVQAKILNQKTYWMWVYTVLLSCLPWIGLVWLFGDKIKVQMEQKRKNLSLPKSKFMNAFKLKTPRVDGSGQTTLTRTPRFEDGQTKEELEAERRELLTVHKVDPEIIELAYIEDSKHPLTVITEFFIKPFLDTSPEGKKSREQKKLERQYDKDVTRFNKELTDLQTMKDDYLKIIKTRRAIMNQEHSRKEEQ